MCLILIWTSLYKNPVGAEVREDVENHLYFYEHIGIEK